MKTSNAIKNALAILMNKKQSTISKKWQAVEIKNTMYEVNDLFIQMNICKSIHDLEVETNADLPWSEDHFKERLAGIVKP
jgi:hypothetical protein